MITAMNICYYHSYYHVHQPFHSRKRDISLPGGGRLVSSGVTLESQLRVWSPRLAMGKCPFSVFLRWVDGWLVTGFVSGHTYIYIYIYVYTHICIYVQGLIRICMCICKFSNFGGKVQCASFVLGGEGSQISRGLMFLKYQRLVFVGGRWNLLWSTGWKLKEWPLRKGETSSKTPFWEFHVRYIPRRFIASFNHVPRARIPS